MLERNYLLWTLEPIIKKFKIIKNQEASFRILLTRHFQMSRHVNMRAHFRMACIGHSNGRFKGTGIKFKDEFKVNQMTNANLLAKESNIKECNKKVI